MLAALAIVAFAGCGGDDEGDTTAAPAVRPETTPALSKAELLAQGDAICAEVNVAVGAASSAVSDADARADQAAELYEAMAERLDELRPDPGAAVGYAEVVAAAQRLAEAEGDPTADSEAALASFRSAAEAYGFERCGEPPSAPAPAPEGEGAPAGETAAAPPEEAPPAEAEPAPEETGGAGAGPDEGGGASPGGGSGGAGSGGIGPG